MKYSEAKQGRVFVIRLEDGDVVHEEIERFAREQSVKAAAMIIIGGADQGSKLVVGPERPRGQSPVLSVDHVLDNAYEIAGTGTIFPDENGQPILHMHMACGRNTETVTGCVRNGVRVWHVAEVVLFELVETSASRVPDPQLGLKLLNP
jgi:predicted DNA-binding protein with PD1-like motif